MKLASFDIFDTALIRKSFSPESIFHILANRLFGKDTEQASEFAQWRKNVEKCLWKTKPNYTIKDIYSELPSGLFPSYTADYIMAQEMETESEYLIANEEIKIIIDKYRGQGFQIAFISDMYLPTSFLKEVLKRNACFVEGDLLYVSCEEQARKSSGELYCKIQNELKPEEWFHFGDNHNSDVRIPKKFHIRSSHIDTTKHGFECQNMSQEVSAILRACRLRLGNSSLATLSVHYVATIYVPYVKWVLSEAQKRKIRRLYFISRDAYIHMRIAETLPHDDIELRYLFVSRKSLSDVEESQNLRKYLLQDGLLDNISTALVDVGWLGTTRRMLNEIIDELGGRRVYSFYFNVWKDALPRTYGDYSSFIEKPIINREITSFIEDFCSACPYPTTIGYVFSDENKWVPVFPKGKIYKETPIVISNIKACEIYREFIETFQISEKTLVETAEKALKYLFSFQDYIDFSPMVDLPGCDGKLAVKRLSIAEIVRISLGDIVTLNDRFSLEISVGLRMTKLIWKSHNFFFSLFRVHNK